MNKLTIPTTFSLDFVGELETVNDLISKVGAKIYYKGDNRNGTWITDDFAEKLSQTVFNIPIVATYDEESGDFAAHTDHGQKKAYGFVPGDSRLLWQTAEDGKEYLTVDVYLWVGYWPEASKLIGKAQSMELDPSTISGDWKVIGGDYYFVYQTGSFKGLCGLGDATLPCFEEAAFFNLSEQSRLFFQSLDKENEKTLEGGLTMDNDKSIEVDVDTEPVANFEDAPQEGQLAAEPTVEPVVDATEFEDEGGETGERLIDESSSVHIDQREQQVYINEDGSITYITEEKTHTIWVSTYYELQEENATLKEQVASLENKVETLSEYKHQAEKAEKDRIVAQFSKRLTEEEMAKFVEGIENYSTHELRAGLSIVLAEKALAEEQEETTPATNFVSVPAGEDTGTAAILRKHKNKQ